jgi:hypothetical protein
MTKAIGMFGSDTAAAKLHVTLRNARVHLERHNFRHPDDILARLAEAPEIAAVLLVENAVRSHDPDARVTLEALRTGDPTVRIVYIRDTPEWDYDFELWCYEWGIYDILYPSRHTDVNIDAMREAVLRGRIDPDNPPPPPPDPNAIPPPEDKAGLGRSGLGRSGLLDRFKDLSLPDLRVPGLSDIKLPSMSEYIRRKQSEKPYDHSAPLREFRKIGVINCSRGFGATSLTVQMAGQLFEAGYSVSVLAMDLKPDLSCSGLAEAGLTVSVPEGDIAPEWVELAASHDFLLIDFGIVYEFLPSGNAVLAQSRMKEARTVKDAYDFCDLRIFLTSEEPWHRMKAGAFESDDKGFLVSTREAEASTILKSLGVLS